MLGIFWDSRRAGPQPLQDEITAIALLGDAVIDLREAKATSKRDNDPCLRSAQRR